MIPAVRVEIYTGEFTQPFLTLDDPVRGELDEALYPLYDGSEADATVDLAADAYAYSTRRGRPNELDEVSVGTMAVEFRNHGGQFVPNSLVESGLFDGSGNLLTDGDGSPLTTDWATYGYDLVTPGKRVRLYLDEIVVFDGHVDDWELEYDVNGDASARMVAVDALGVLAQQTLDAWTTTAQTASERIEAVLDRTEIEFGANRNIGSEDGSTSLQADTVADGTNAWRYVKLVTYSDLGYTFASRLGLLTFVPRRSITTTIAATFADDDSGIPFSGISPGSQSRYIYNRVSVTRIGGSTQTVEDADSIAAYGLRTLELVDLLMNSDTDALNLAGSLLALYKSPATRIERLDINMGSLTDSQRATVLSLDLGDYVSLTWTPRGTEATTVNMRIEGIDHGGTYNGVGAVSLSLSPATYFPEPFLLDDSTYGVLDASEIFY